MNQKPDKRPDLLKLASAKMPTLLEALEAAADGGLDKPGIPPATRQLAKLIRGESVRLIRLGANSELSEAAVELALFMGTAQRTVLKERDPEAERILASTVNVLSAAVPSFSAGSEIGALKSWNGMAGEVVAMLWRERGLSMQRSVLKDRLGITNESHLSHLLADLEAVGLVERVRDRKTIEVHLGIRGRSDQVREAVGAVEPPNEEVAKTLRQLKDMAAQAEHLDLDLAVAGMDSLQREFAAFQRGTDHAEIRIEDEISDGDLIGWIVRYSGTAPGDPEERELVHEQAWRARVSKPGEVSVNLFSTTVEEFLTSQISLPWGLESRRAVPRFSRPVGRLVGMTDTLSVLTSTDHEKLSMTASADVYSIVGSSRPARESSGIGAGMDETIGEFQEELEILRAVSA